jgi:hypothetical protein
MGLLNEKNKKYYVNGWKNFTAYTTFTAMFNMIVAFVCIIICSKYLRIFFVIPLLLSVVENYLYLNSIKEAWLPSKRKNKFVISALCLLFLQLAVVLLLSNEKIFFIISYLFVAFMFLLLFMRFGVTRIMIFASAICLWLFSLALNKNFREGIILLSIVCFYEIAMRGVEIVLYREKEWDDFYNISSSLTVGRDLSISACALGPILIWISTYRSLHDILSLHQVVLLSVLMISGGIMGSEFLLLKGQIIEKKIKRQQERRGNK